jgi:hypothetical protein
MASEAGGADAQPTAGLGTTARRLSLAALMTALLGLTAALVPGFHGDAPFLSGFSLPWWAMALFFVGTETFVLNIQAKRETQTISFSELPLVLGLFFASPTALLTGRLLASVAVMVLVRR